MTEQKATQFGALVLRLGLGVMFVAHAWLKISVFTIDGTVQFFESVGYPGWFAYPTIAAELGGGLLLLLGVRTRLIAALLVPVLIGAAQVHFANGWVFSNQGGGWEYPIFLTLAAIVQVLVGPGAYAFDVSLKRGLTFTKGVSAA